MTKEHYKWRKLGFRKRAFTLNIKFDKIGTSREVYFSGVDDAIDEKGNTEA